MGESHTIPADAVDAFTLAVSVASGGYDAVARISELEEQMSITEQRLIKAKQKKASLDSKCRNSNLGVHSRSKSRHEKTNERIDATSTKVTQLRNQLLALQREYAAMQAVRMNLPLNFVMNSRAYQKNGVFHFLVGYFDEEIGKNHHGHFVILKDGRCAYARFPFEPHGSGNHFRPALEMYEVMAAKCD